jgi:hypothetical protein
MLEFLHTFFTPLNKESCIYFLVLSMVFFAILIFALFADVYFMIKNFKILNFRFIQGGILILFNLFVAYFVNRLLYTMCVKSLI